ncbi:MAG: prepilin-type N-terminal cleavage/methylation domain-containing protein [Alteromonadaceae bacterium]|jgi:prepilin-type N-terminal cleavage/methylation domain-containing protein
MKRSHKFKTNRSDGFTLIELMIVMSIVALLMSLVGPLTIKSYEKVKAKEEVSTLKNWIKGNSYRSFATAKQGIMALSQNTITFRFADDDVNTINRDSVNSAANNTGNGKVNINEFNNEIFSENNEQEPVATKTFEYLSFPLQEISVNTFGLVSLSSITVQIKDKITILKLSENTLIIEQNNDN